MSWVDDEYPDIPAIDVAADISDEEIHRLVEAKLESGFLPNGEAISVHCHLRDYLKQKFEFDLGFDGKCTMPNWERMFLLVARNGGFLVHGWGYLSTGGLFGSGLDQNDAISLIQYSNLLDGYSMAAPENPHAKDQVVPAFREFVGIRKGLVKAREAAAGAVSNEPANG